MHLTISGSGTAIVFIHGYCEDASIWKEFEKKLASNFKVILIDLPGHGKSPLLSTQFTIDEIADQVHDVLVENGIEHYFLIGHSLGGYVSLALADLYAESVLGFGLFSSTTYADDEEKKKARDKVGGFIAQHGVDKFIEPFVPNLIAKSNRSLLAKEMDDLIAIGKKTSAEAIVGYALAMKNRPDRTVLVSKPMFPKFIIAGDSDMAVRLEASEKMIALMANGSSLILKETGHNGYIESPRESFSFIQSFLESNFS